MLFKKKTDNIVSDLMVQGGAGKKRGYLKWALVLVIILAIIFWIVMGAVIVAAVKVSLRVQDATTQASTIKQSINNGKIADAQKSLELLIADVNQARMDIKNIGPIGAISQVKKNQLALDNLLTALSDLLLGYNKILTILTTVDTNLRAQNSQLGFGTAEQKREFLKVVGENRIAFNDAAQLIEKANKEIENVETGEVSNLFRDKAISIVSLLRQTVENTDMALPIVSNLPEILGLDQDKTYLFVFQNNMEMRATGGFIGSYGVMTVRNGEMKTIFTDDVYNLDKLSIGKLQSTPPAPMVAYNKQTSWFMRDANWSPDWPTSAQQILTFFNQERAIAGLPAQKIDGVIALTPEFISNLLAVLGPITIDGLTFEQNNFSQDLEKFVEFDYANRGIHETNRKSIMGPLTEMIIDRLHRLSPDELLKVWTAFKDNIDEKNILVYLVDPEVQKYFTNRNWSGSVKSVGDSDFLMVVDSNFTALKTDQVMDKSFYYNVYRDNEGNLIGHLEMTYKHTGKYQTGVITNYRDYLRVYVPDGAWFVRGNVGDDKGGYDLQYGKNVEVVSDLQKKYIATYFTVNPGLSQRVVMEYRLPDSIRKAYENGAYSLVVQKQPGTIGHKLKITLNFSKYISAYVGPTKPSSFTGTSISWDTNLQVDRVFRLKF